MKRLVLLSTVFAFLTVGPALAAPMLTECHTVAFTDDIVCNVYPSVDVAGTAVASDISDPYTLFEEVTAGYVVLTELPDSDETDITTWSAVLVFNSANPTVIQLFSAGCNVGPEDRSCFPSFATVNAAAHIFIAKNQSGVGDDFTDFTPYQADPNHLYNIFGASDVEVDPVPEPATLTMLGIGLVGLVAAARKRAAASRAKKLA